MSLARWILAAALAGGFATGPVLRADDTAEEIKQLKQQIEVLMRKVQALEEKTAVQSQPAPATAPTPPAADPRVEQLEQQVKGLEQQREAEHAAAAEKAKTTPVVSLGSSGFQVRTPDSNFVFGIRGYFQGDGRFGVASSAATYDDTFLMRRVRPIFEGSLYKVVDYRVMLDFGSGITSSSTATTSNDGFLQEAYANFRLWPEFQIMAGKMKEPVGLERLQSSANLLFIERGFPTLLVPNFDVGVQAHGYLLDRKLTYQAGVFNGATDGGSVDFQSDEAGNVASRLFAQPFRGSGLTALEGLGFGLAGTYGSYYGPMRTYVSPGQRVIFGYYTGTGLASNVLADGTQWRFTPQGYWYLGPFGLFGEYVVSSQDVIQAGGGVTKGSTATLANRAWAVSASYFLTGEDNSWNPVKIKKPVTFGKESGWGAWELAARVQGINFDDAAYPIFANPATTPTGAFAWAVGLNWHMNRNLKLSLDYENTHFDGGAGNPYTAQNEQTIFTRFQLSF